MKCALLHKSVISKCNTSCHIFVFIILLNIFYAFFFMLLVMVMNSKITI